MTTYYPGTRVMVFDHRLYKDDRRTPPEVTIKPATVLSWYGRLQRALSGHACDSDLVLGPYPSLIDVRFDHDPERVSVAHFADEVYVQVIGNITSEDRYERNANGA